VASLQRPVLVSKLAPVTLSSSGTPVSEAQPDINQATAARVMMNFMDCLLRGTREGRLNLSMDVASLPRIACRLRYLAIVLQQ
jgi:hypothetical protein